MGFIEDLIKTPEGRKSYEREGFIFRVTEAICTAMDERGLKKADLARQLGTNKSHITQLLSGHRNMTLAKVAEIMHVLGYRVEIKAYKLEGNNQAQPTEFIAPAESNYSIAYTGPAWKTEKAPCERELPRYLGAA